MRQLVVMITGSAGNLGRAVVQELSLSPARLVCVERSPEKLSQALASLPPEMDVLGLDNVDLTDIVSCQDGVRRAHDRFGHIDALVNTVGGFKMGPVDQFGIDQWDALMTLNARSAYAISAAVLPRMQERKHGRIVHVAAAPGLKAGSHQSAYAASKAAVIRLTEAIAAENRINRITANCILPGTIDTPQNREAMPNADTETWVSASAIARLIAFLVSDEASAVTGGAIQATGF
ncbi:SDR family NAD(P)-dependent oxidoreductase [Rhizobium tubonense]|uniref:3-oxoacyl-ACP reductase n=1 Tax=Rhizobium tubonense TaxID=484088 RepID=A0A2W4C4S3_9HYPH|nr:SDR family NAD(P)-dependent oxidoreductase [Rhizobium tubonense]PZM08051.1 3-oxoacyl-ACP reductase [Rhizobium tubonense]